MPKLDPITEGRHSQNSQSDFPKSPSKSTRRGVLIPLAVICIVFLGVCVLHTSLCLTLLVKDCYKSLFPAQQPEFVWHPFLTSKHASNAYLRRIGYGGNPRTVFEWRTNSQGCRDSVEYQAQKPVDVIRWICLGGSATVWASSNQYTIPAQIQTKLNEVLSAKNTTAGKRVEVYNFGRVSWDSTQELFLLATELQQYSPDFLLIYDGRNDAMWGVMPEYRPFWNMWSYEIDRNLNDQSAFKRLFYPFWRLFETFRRFKDPEMYARQKAQFLFGDRKNAEWNFYKPHKEIGRIYLQNLQTMISVAERMGCKGVCLILQPQLNWCEKPLSQEEKDFTSNLQPSWETAMQTLYPIMREAHSTAALSSRIPVVTANLNSIIKNHAEWLFLEDCHFTDYGNRLAAEEIVPFMLQLMQDESSNKSKNDGKIRSSHVKL